MTSGKDIDIDLVLNTNLKNKKWLVLDNNTADKTTIGSRKGKTEDLTNTPIDISKRDKISEKATKYLPVKLLEEHILNMFSQDINKKIVNPYVIEFNDTPDIESITKSIHSEFPGSTFYPSGFSPISSKKQNTNTGPKIHSGIGIGGSKGEASFVREPLSKYLLSNTAKVVSKGNSRSSRNPVTRNKIHGYSPFSGRGNDRLYKSNWMALLEKDDKNINTSPKYINLKSNLMRGVQLKSADNGNYSVSNKASIMNQYYLPLSHHYITYQNNNKINSNTSYVSLANLYNDHETYLYYYNHVNHFAMYRLKRIIKKSNRYLVRLLRNLDAVQRIYYKRLKKHIVL